MESIEKEILHILKELVSIPSVATNPQRLDEIISFSENYLKSPLISVQRFTHNSIPSLLATSKDWTGKGLLLNAHLDVVPGSEEQFSLKVEGNKAYGRGVYDMKAAAAVLMVLFKYLAQSNKLTNNVALMIVTDEEIGGHNGTKFLLDQEKIYADFFLAGEPTELNICCKQKGAIWLEIIEKGISAHASRPWEGINANVSLAQKITNFYKKNPQPMHNDWKTTYNLSFIEGGEAGNMVASRAKAQLDIRYIETETKQNILNNIQDSFPDTDINILLDEPYLNTDKNSPSIKLLQSIISNTTEELPQITNETFASDGRFYAAAGIPSINFGPKGGNMHAENEWVDIKSLCLYYSILQTFVLKF